MRIALIGAPGSGKGTQAQLLAQRYRVPHISTGELLRQAVQSDKNFPPQARQDIEAGLLVDDDLVRTLLEDRLRQRDTKRGFVIDGYPRNIPQAQSLDNLLGMLGRGLQIAVYNQVSEDVLIKRNTGRLICAKCGTIFNRFFSPPAKKGVCDQCGGHKLESRKEDTEKTVAIRVESYKEFITPLITYYRAQHKLRTVSAMGSVDEIHEKICAIVDLEIRPLEIDALVTAGHTRSEEESTIIAGGKISRLAPSTEPVPQKKPASKSSVAPVAGSTTSKTGSKSAGGKKTAKKTTGKKATAKKATASKTKASVGSEAPKKPVKKATTSKPASKKVAKKTAAKKAAVKKKAVTRKSTAKKTTARKVPKKVAKKAAAKKTTAKKSTARKVASKPVAKKSAAKKAKVNKATVKKTPAKKTQARKAAGKKVAKKSTAKKAAAKKKAVTRKTTANKTNAKKTAAKSTAKKAVAKKATTSKKKAAGKTSKKARAGKKPGKKKSVAKKAAGKKSTAKKKR